MPTLEDHINARVLGEGLQRAGSGVARSSLISALQSIITFNMGGMTVNYGNGNRLGSSFVDMGVVDRDGRITS